MAAKKRKLLAGEPFESRCMLTAEANAVIGLDSVQLIPHQLRNRWHGYRYRFAILDDGFDSDHPYFGNRVKYTWDFIDNNADVNTTTSDHGTNVATIAAGYQAGVFSGVAPAADIIKDETGTGPV